MGDVNDNVTPELSSEHQLEDSQHRFEGVTHPLVLSIPNQHKGVDISPLFQLLDDVLDVFGVPVVRIVHAWGIDDDARSPVGAPDPRGCRGVVCAGVGAPALSKALLAKEDVPNAGFANSCGNASSRCVYGIDHWKPAMT